MKNFETILIKFITNLIKVITIIIKVITNTIKVITNQNLGPSISSRTNFKKLGTNLETI